MCAHLMIIWLPVGPWIILNCNEFVHDNNLMEFLGMNSKIADHSMLILDTEPNIDMLSS